jgi:prolipoprotein diacylglyceryltransferase
MFATYLILNGIERFFIEKIRVNNKFDVLGLTMTQAELISVFFVLLGIILIVYRRRVVGNSEANQPPNDEKITAS